MVWMVSPPWRWQPPVPCLALDPDRNLYLGVDMEGEDENAEVWYSRTIKT